VRGFRLRAVGQRLYVQLSGQRVPLYLNYDAAPNDVQGRGIELRAFLVEREWRHDAQAWRDACAVSRVKTGKPLDTPRTNGKAERFIKALLSEWANAMPFQTSEERNRWLPRYLGLLTAAGASWTSMASALSSPSSGC